MNSQVYKFVAGGGKTTISKGIMDERNNGLYIAFTNSVVNDMKKSGYLAKTIDSLFTSFIMPKFYASIPLINNHSLIRLNDVNITSKFIDTRSRNIRINTNGEILFKGKIQPGFTLQMSNSKLQSHPSRLNLDIIKNIFRLNELNVSFDQMKDLSSYLMHNYSNEILSILRNRFSYIIIDEAQDLHGYLEEFAKMLYASDIETILLGDDNQNIKNKGHWFEGLDGTNVFNRTYRCTEQVCSWIREQLKIDIYGTNNIGGFYNFNIVDIDHYNDGNRILIYQNSSGKKDIIDSWLGESYTVGNIKGSTVHEDIVIVGKEMNIKNYYTSITRTTKNVYSCIKKIRK
ncbi:MAG: UvrD-helicase domain-containing protein [Acholeplasmataceae bacterium]|nr:UvrD-helicase domain-containing protein [Acholeplasmataceae bacterium]